MLQRTRWNAITGWVALLGLTTATTAAGGVPEEVRFAYAGGPCVWILGKIDGSFDKALGTKVKWVPFATGADVLTLFAAKEIDIARFGWFGIGEAWKFFLIFISCFLSIGGGAAAAAASVSQGRVRAA